MGEYTDRTPTSLTWADIGADADLIEGATPGFDDAGMTKQRLDEPKTDYSDRSNPSTTWADR